MWYQLVRCENKNFLLCIDESSALWKKEISINFEDFLKDISEEEKHNILIGMSDIETIKKIPFKDAKKGGIDEFYYALKTSKMFTNGQKIAICAQSLLESNFGKSYLAMNANNYCGMMWRNVFEGHKEFSPIKYTSPSDGIDTYYLKCAYPADFLIAYMLFIERSIYEGWEEKKTALEYISHLKACGYASDDNYVNKVSSLFNEAEKILGIKEDEKPIPPQNNMPKIDIKEYDSPNCSDRNATIYKIVLHNTAGSFNGSISWLCNPQARASAHLVISRKGETACIVPFSKTAWHAGNSRINHCSIGIEIEATNNQKGLTKEQEEKLILWIKWLMKKYNIKKEDVGIHRWFSSTDCPILIWSTDKSFTDWREKNI